MVSARSNKGRTLPQKYENHDMWYQAMQPERNINTKTVLHNKKLEATQMLGWGEPGHAGPEKGPGAWNQNLSSMFKNLNTLLLKLERFRLNVVQLITANLKHKFNFEFDQRTKHSNSIINANSS